MGYKKEMMESEIMKIVSQALLNMKDPRIAGMISVTRVELSNDKRYAKIYLSLYGNEEEKNTEIFGIIEKAKGYFKTEIARNIHTFKAPEITFVRDRGIEKSFEIDKLFKKIENERHNQS
ncbi:30S ribosome-binding factor RbfA [Athalassotoga saccharophila]|uniref:30S ribosome-binding factor RbfA n=1 Tax=Athalassotoga saccharophila TaxID=1441386 RepID=UPI0018D9ABD0|nr:30S ribosome-binding factor RbfA [Athalassotoga saccharophila]BBJ28548.1 ribosome-binding factor A [Athalassotoga saccharophila]